MHALHIETGRHLYGGAQQVVYLMRGLSAQGIENTLVCPAGSAIAAAVSGLDVRVVETPMGGDLDVSFLWRLRRIFKRTKPDLVHCHSRRGADVYGGRAAAMARLPAVVSRRVDNPLSPVLARLSFRPFSRVVAISNAIAEVLRSAGVADEKLSVIRSAVDAKAFETDADRARLAEQFGIEPGHVAIACAAQLIPRKGQRFLLEALAELRTRCPQLRVVFFGEGRDAAELNAQLQSLNLEGLAQFAGFRPDLDAYLGAFDLLVHPALAEGLGVIVLKAQAAGVPVVAFRAGGVVEVVLDRETGRLTPPADVPALAEAIAALSENPALRAEYAEKARARAQRHFAIDRMVEQHVQLYEAVLGE